MKIAPAASSAVIPLPKLSSAKKKNSVNTVPTVSDTKRSFYAHHSRPINSIYRRVIEELMVEMHLLSVNANFTYDPIYALGVVTSFDRFMTGYEPEADRESIFRAVCQALNGNAEQYRQDAQSMLDVAGQLSGAELQAVLRRSPEASNQPALQETVKAIADRQDFKYSRLFAIGLYTLMEQADPSLLESQDQLETLTQAVSDALGLPAEKFKKDLELYRSNLEKLQQARETMTEIVQAERKRREQRALEKQQKAAADVTASEAAPVEANGPEANPNETPQ
jgi:photosystem II biogenesis protein Psp29